MSKPANNLTQYCNMVLEWEQNGITIDNASKIEIVNIQKLQATILEQSGLTLNELTLIMTCSNYKIFKNVNVYARKQIELIKKETNDAVSNS